MKLHKKAVVVLGISLFVGLLSLQFVFLFFPDIPKERRGMRMGATFSEESQATVEVEQQEEGAFVLLTFESATPSRETYILVDGEILGDFGGSIVSVRGHPGETISFYGKAGEKISLLEYPKNLQGGLSTTILLGDTEVDWGMVQLK